MTRVEVVLRRLPQLCASEPGRTPENDPALTLIRGPHCTRFIFNLYCNTDELSSIRDEDLGATCLCGRGRA
jgi:hypothetical protein